MKLLHFRHNWWPKCNRTDRTMLITPMIEQKVNISYFSEGSVMHNFIFTSDNRFYKNGEYSITSMQETMEHRIIRSRKKMQFNMEIAKKEEIIEVNI
jgi:hypothetical protein